MDDPKYSKFTNAIITGALIALGTMIVTDWVEDRQHAAVVETQIKDIQKELDLIGKILRQHLYSNTSPHFNPH